MKKIVKNFVVSATLVAALLVAVAVQAKDATLTGTTGTVESLGKGGAWQKISANKPVKVGSTLRTGSTVGSLASFRLSNIDSLVVLNENTTLTLDAADSKKVSGQDVTDTALRLATGRVTGNVNGLNGASKYVIKTPSRDVIVKGSNAEFSVGADGSVIVTKGAVDVQTAKGLIPVAAGQTLPVGSDAVAPTDPNLQAGIATQVASANRDNAGKAKKDVSVAGDGEIERGVTNPNYDDVYDKFVDKVEKDHRGKTHPLTGQNDPVTPW